MLDQQEASQLSDDKQGNRIAAVGAVASVVPPLGLALSIVGLIRSKTVSGAGKVTAALGIALSLVFAAGYGFAISQAGDASGPDPACATAKSTLQSIQRTLNADSQNVPSPGAGPGDVSALNLALVTDANDIGNAQTAVEAVLGKSTYADVRSQLQALDTALGQAGSAFGGGDVNPVAEVNAALAQLATTSGSIGKLCGSGAKG